MPNVVRYNSSATKKYEDLAKVLGKETAEEYAVTIEELRAAVEVPASVKEYGIAEAEWSAKLDEITENAMADPCVGANPRTPTETDIRKIFECCYNGTRIDF
ncbi:MAG: iron-containing alcohol dehydrogenase [Candidatus Electrothrix sp. ATG1]|nr:iron-containing alcohol dehydrogenase [Candidatus Electrothrix sp. ATG1]